MEDHPSPTALEAFLRGALSIGEAKPVIAHLLNGCARCQKLMKPQAQALFFPGRGEAEGSAESYDFPIFRAINQARIQAVEMERSFVPPPILAGAAEEVFTEPSARTASSLNTPEGCEALLAASRELRHQDPEGMVFLATLAVGLAERLDRGAPSIAAIADLRSRAWAELGNARRVSNDLQGAEAALERSLAWAEEGSRAPLLIARLLDLTASLYSDQRRFEKAFDLLDVVHRIYLRLGERHLAGRALISKGNSYVLNNEPEDALRLIVSGLDLVDRRQDPALVLAAVHGIIDVLVRVERFVEAQALLRSSRRLYYEYADELNFLKLRWVEGKINAGLGMLPRAEAAFQEVRDGFRAHEMSGQLAAASLDLGAVWLAQGRTAELRELIEETVQTFQALRIQRDALAALLMLREAVATEQATVALLRGVAEQLLKLQYEAAS